MSAPLAKFRVSGSKELEFHKHFLVHNGEKILYSDVDGFGFLHTATKRSINFIPVGTSHSYWLAIKARGVKHSIHFTGSQNTEVFQEIASAINQLIKPFVFINLLLEYAKDNKLEIDSITLSPQGIYKKRIGLHGSDSISWDQYYNSTLNAGNAFIYKKDEKKKYKEFYRASMSSTNAPMLPDIINFLFKTRGVFDEATKKEIINAKTDLMAESAKAAFQVTDTDACPKCGEKKVEEGQKFCAKCGSSLST